MRRAAAIACVLAALAPAPAAAQDRWLGQDKLLHFSASLALASGGYTVAAWSGAAPIERVAWSSGLALSFGIGKELYDAAFAEGASWRDLGWDLIGTLIGTALCWSVDTLATRAAE